MQVTLGPGGRSARRTRAELTLQATRMCRGWMGHPPYDPGSGSGAQVLVSLDFHETIRDIAALALQLKPDFSAGQPGTWMTRWASRQVKQHGGWLRGRRRMVRPRSLKTNWPGVWTKRRV